MNLEPIKVDMKVFDDELSQFGQGVVITVEDNMVEVLYRDIEEVVEYSLNEANRHLHFLL